MVSRREDGDVVVADGVFKLLEKKRFLNKFGEFGVMGIEKSDEDGVRVNLS